MNQTLTKKLKPILPFAALPLLLVALLMLLTDTTSAPYREVHSENGVWDLRDFDFENYNARLTGDVVYIPNALLTPEEFAARSGEVILGNTANINFLTSRVLILVPNDMWYSFTRDSILHSHRQYVNGLWIEEAQRGSPGHNRQSEIAGEGKITFTARPVSVAGDGADVYYMIELVQQSSSFVHSRNDHHMGWLIGEGAGLIAESRAMDFQRGITMGFFFLLFLLFLMMYFMLQRNRAALYFSLFCLMWLLRMGTTGVWAFSVLMPWMDWSVKFRINYIAIPAAAILSLAIIDVLFPKTLHKIVLRINYIFSAVFIALYLFADTVFMSNALLVSYVIFGLTILYILVSFIFKVRNTQFGQKVFIIGMVFFLFATISDFFHFSFDFVIMPFEMTGIGMLIFALCMAAAVFVATMREVEKAKENENRLATENVMLGHEKRFREDVMATVSHELRTPLTVMSVYAEMAVAEIKGGNVSDQTASDLNTISDEAQRLSELASNALAMFGKKAAVKTRANEPVNIGATAVQLANLLAPAAKNRNIKINLSLPDTLPNVWGKPDELTRVLWNLFDNALKHTENGCITVDGTAIDGFVTLTIKDTGEGMTPETKSQAFERGFSGTDRTGLGLALCKEIIKAHGGEINIESTAGEGTAVTVALPEYMEDIAYE